MGGLFGGGSQKISTSAPLISSLRMQTSSYGRAIPLLYGKTRVASNVIWFGDFKSIEHRSTQSAGGKGGGGGTTMESISYTYQTAVLLGLCEGPVMGVTNAWVGKKSGSIGNWNLSQFTGSYNQQPMPYLATYHPGEALSYRGTAYVGTGLFDLGDDATLPNMTFEVDSSFGFSAQIRDANPADVARDYCTNPYYGAGVPASKFGDLTAFSDFCVANGLFVSPAYTEQEPAHEAMSRLFKLTNSGVYHSDGKIKVVPYSDLTATGNGVTFTPYLTPVYDLTYDDFLADAGSDPIECSRIATSDAYNCIRVKFFNRSSGYNEEIAEAKDQASIEQFGLRVQEVELHEIVDAGVARFVAQQILQRTLYVRNTYEFRLGWKYALLEPTDLVTLTDAALGLDKAPVRITEIEEDEDGDLTVRAEEVPIGSVGATKYPTQTGSGYTVNYNVPPGPANTPVIFEPPLALASAPEIWIAMSGGANWGGCDVWVSDDDATYQRIGRITGKSRHGILSAALASGSGVDTINTAKVDLSASGGAMLSATQQNALDLVTLCYVDGELMAYRDATLTAPNKYDLGYLVRGAYGTTIGSHAAGTKFARLDQTLAKFPYDKARVGKTVYLKFQSFNIYGGGIEDLATLTPVTYQITGAPLADVTGLALEQPFTGRSCKIKWNTVDAAAGYTVEVWAGSPQTLRRTVSVGDARRYEYSWEDATADGGPWRQLTFKVRAISQTGASGNWAILVASNPVPAALTGVTVSAGFNSVFFSCSTPADPDFAGVRIWLSTASGFTPGDSNLVYDGPDCFSTLYKLANGTALAAGTTYYLKAAGYDSFGKTGLNISSEVAVTPVSVAGSIKPGEITATMIANGAIDMAKFASGIRPPRVVSSLPALPNATWADGDTAVLTTDGKLYRVVGGVWKKDVDAADISGQVQAAQLAGIEASKVTGQLTDAQIAAVAAAKLTGQITTAQIAANAIDQSKLAADMEVPKQVSTLPVTHQGTDLVVLTTDRKLYRWNGTAYVSSTAAADITGQLAASQVAALEASKITGQLTDSQLAAISAAKVSGQLASSQLADGAITAAKIAAGVIDQTKLAADMEVPKQVSALPSTYQGTDLVVLTTDRKLYRWNGTAYVSSTAAADITGQLAASQVAALEASKITGQLTDAQLAAISAAKLTGQIAGAQLAAGAVSSDKLNIEIGGGNLCINSSFEGGMWPLYNNGNATRRQDVGRIAGLCQVTVTGSTPGTTFGVYHLAVKGGWQTEQYYIVSFYAKKVNGAGMLACWLSWNNGPHIQNAISNPNLTTQWQRYVFKIRWNAGVTTPVANGLGFLWINSTGTRVEGDEIWIDDVQVEAGDVVTAYAPKPDEILPGTITATEISDSAITTPKLAAGAVVAGKIAANAISATEIQSGAITTAKLAAGVVTANELAAGAVVAGKIAAGAVTATELAAGAVTTAKLTAGAVTANELAAGAVVAGKIAANAVTANELAANSVTSAKIQAGSIGATQIAANAITTEKLVVAAGNLVPNSDFATGDMTNWRPWANTQNISVIAATDPAVPAGAPTKYVARYVLSSLGVAVFTHVKAYNDSGAETDGIPVVEGEQYSVSIAAALQAGSVGGVVLVYVYYRMNTGAVSGFNPCINKAIPEPWGTYTGSFTVPAGAVRAYLYVYNTGNASYSGAMFWTNLRCARKASSDLIVDGAVTASKVEAGAITTAKLAAAAVTANELAAGSVVAGKIAAGAVTATELAAGAVTTAKLAAGSVDALSIAAGAVVAGKIAANAVTANELAANAVTAGKIQAGAITATAIAAGSITASKLAIADLTNAVLNPEFAYGGTLSTDGWAGNVTAMAASEASVPTGAPSRFVASLAVLSSGANDATANNYIPVAPGEQYYLEIWCASDAAANRIAQLMVSWNDAEKSTVSWSAVATRSAPNQTWSKISGVLTVPALVNGKPTAFMRFMFSTRGSSGGAGTWYFAKPVLRKAASAELIVDGAITTAKLAAAAVTANELAAGSVVAGKIAAGTVTATELAAGSVTTAKLAAGAVTASELAAGAVVAGKIAASAITANELAANSVTTAKIQAGAIGAAQIAAGAITADKLLVMQNPMTITSDPSLQDTSDWSIPAPASVVTVSGLPIGNKAILAGATVTTIVSRMVPIEQSKTYLASAWANSSGSAKTVYFLVAFYDASGAIISGQGTGWSLGTYNYFGLVNQVPTPGWAEYRISFGSGGTASIPAGARFVRIGALLNYNSSATGDVWIGGMRIQQVSDGTLIANGAVTTDKVAANAITADKIAANQISATHIIAGSLTGDRLAANTITADKIQTGAITANEIAASAITAAKIATGAVTADKVSASSLSAITANLGTITAGKAQNTSGTNVIDLNASGTQSFIKVGSAVDIKADGSGMFARTIVSAPDVRRSGTATVDSGVLYGGSAWITYIDTGYDLPAGWASASTDMFLASATIAGGMSWNGGLNAYSYAEVCHGDGLLSGGPNSPIDNRIYIRYMWLSDSNPGGSIRITQINWKLVRV